METGTNKKQQQESLRVFANQSWVCSIKPFRSVITPFIIFLAYLNNDNYWWISLSYKYELFYYESVKFYNIDPSGDFHFGRFGKSYFLCLHAIWVWSQKHSCLCPPDFLSLIFIFFSWLAVPLKHWNYTRYKIKQEELVTVGKTI